MIPPIAWVGIAIVLLLIIGSVDAKIGGWLLLLIVMGMVWSAHAHNPPLI